MGPGSTGVVLGNFSGKHQFNKVQEEGKKLAMERDGTVEGRGPKQR